MSTAYLGLGSNVDAEHHIALAVRALIKAFGEVQLSPIYRTKSVGFEGCDFINLVARVETGCGPLELRQFLRELEDLHGRNRQAPKFSDRTLDIDILLFDDLVTRTDKLVLPRAEILRFAHVLKPLADIAPQLKHPVEATAFAELWARGDWADAGLELMDSAFLQKK